ncbi:MAG: 8-amino-7-oxononanoate synthase [Micromonosporaceae bacterium]
MTGWLADLRHGAAQRAAAGLSRQLRARAAHDPTTDLAGNDYLGLSRHPSVVAAAVAATRQYGLGATSSRLVRGSTAEHAALEDQLAELLGWPSALVFSSGYLANLAAIRALATSDARIVSDAHAHASLIDGCRLARAETVVVPHASPDAVRGAVLGAEGRGAVVVTESIFSVDGDLAPLRELHRICVELGAVLLVDDAHGLGVLGPYGAGGVAAAGLAGAENLVVTATLSKAAGGAGGVVAGPAPVIEHLVDTGRSFIYDTGLPPATAAGCAEALRLIRDGDASRAALADRANTAVKALRDARLDVTQPAGGVISVTAPGPEQAVAWAAACAVRGVAVGCFRPPSTPDKRSRLRLTINTGIPREDFERALTIIIEEAP